MISKRCVSAEILDEVTNKYDDSIVLNPDLQISYKNNDLGDYGYHNISSVFNFNPKDFLTNITSKNANSQNQTTNFAYVDHTLKIHFQALVYNQSSEKYDTSIVSNSVIVYKFLEAPEFCLNPKINTGYGMLDEEVVTLIDFNKEQDFLSVQIKVRVCKGIPNDILNEEEDDSDEKSEGSNENGENTGQVEEGKTKVKTAKKEKSKSSLADRKLENALAQLGMFAIEEEEPEPVVVELPKNATTKPKLKDNKKFTCPNDVNYDIESLNGKVDLELYCKPTYYLESFNNTKEFLQHIGGYQDCIYYVTVQIQNSKNFQKSNANIGKFFTLLNPVTILESLGEEEVAGYFPELDTSAVKGKMIEKQVDIQIDEMMENNDPKYLDYMNYTYDSYLENFDYDVGERDQADLISPESLHLPKSSNAISKTNRKTSVSPFHHPKPMTIRERYLAKVKKNMKEKILAQKIKEQLETEKEEQLSRQKIASGGHDSDKKSDEIHRNIGEIRETPVEHLTHRLNQIKPKLQIEPYRHELMITTRNKLNHIHVKYTIPKNSIVCRFDYICDNKNNRKFLQSEELFPKSPYVQTSTRNIVNFVVFYNEEESCWSQVIQVNMTCSNGVVVNEMVSSNFVSIGKAPAYQTFRQKFVAEHWNTGLEEDDQKKNGTHGSEDEDEHGDSPIIEAGRYSVNEVLAAFQNEEKQVRNKAKSSNLLKMYDEFIKSGTYVQKESGIKGYL